jgi:hypothetical protein
MAHEHKEGLSILPDRIRSCLPDDEVWRTSVEQAVPVLRLSAVTSA